MKSVNLQDTKWIYQSVAFLHTSNKLSERKIKKIIPFTTAIKIINYLEIIILSEVSQRKTNIIWYHSYVDSNLKDTNELYLQNRNRLTDIKNEFMVTKGETWGGGNKSGV